jgi:ABC-type nitrate/sulfonate/bicarbonate transport system permease component
VAAVHGYGRWATLRRVVLPGAVPLLLAGARISLGVAWMMVVGAELFGADSGIGFMITYARNLFESDVILLGVGVVGLVGLGMDWGLGRLERRLLAWRTVHADD